MDSPRNIFPSNNSLKLWSKIPIVSWIWLKSAETQSFMIWWKIKDARWNKPTFLLFKDSSPQLISIRKACFYKLILFQDVSNKIQFWITFSTSKKKDGKSLKLRTKLSESPWLQTTETIVFTRWLTWILLNLQWIMCKSIMLPKP